MRSYAKIHWPIALATFVVILALGGCGSTAKLKAAPAATPVAKTETPKKGPGRVQVQHGLDADAKLVNLTPKPVTVEQLLATRDQGTSKIDLAAYKDKRVAPFETTTFEVKGTIKSIVHEKDGDFYFVLKGKSGTEAVIEVPDPKLCQGSPLLPEIVAARTALDKRYHPTSTNKELNEDITVDGVGFLGSRRKKGSGTFGSSARLMPGTGIKFGG